MLSELDTVEVYSIEPFHTLPLVCHLSDIIRFTFHNSSLSELRSLVKCRDRFIFGSRLRSATPLSKG